MKLVRDLLLVAWVCSITGSVVVLAKNGDHHMNNRGTIIDFLNFLFSLVRTFCEVAAKEDYGSKQSGFLLLLNEEQIEHLNATFQPPLVFPTRRGPTLTPTNRTQCCNHLAAIPDLWTGGAHVHAEIQLVDNLVGLINDFTQNGHTVAVIVLYTYYVPCVNCTRRIQEDFLRYLHSYNFIVLYKEGEGKHDLNESYTQNVFSENNINLVKMANTSSNTAEHCPGVSSCEQFGADNHDALSVNSDSRDEEEEKKEEKGEEMEEVEEREEREETEEVEETEESEEKDCRSRFFNTRSKIETYFNY